jgi:DNA polymerase
MIMLDQNCVRCPALVASRSRIVHGYGDHASPIVFIGEAPGRHGADLTGLPFTGDKSGRILRAILRELGLLADGQPACFLTNVVRCCPPGNRTPRRSEVAHCASWLDAELAALEPRIVVPVGRLALGAVAARWLASDPGPIRAAHARPIAAGAITLVPMLHPSRISHAQVAAFIAAMRPLLEAAGIATMLDREEREEHE